MSQMPLSVVGGFLGAGKTTLVNHLLRTADRRWGVLVNDFGALNIDAALIEAGDDAVIALANGCVCCRMGADLGDGLATLASRVPPPEHVLIEASGVGDPRRIAQTALIEPGFSLEPLIVLVDAAGLFAQLADRYVAETVTSQLAFADVVVVSKGDLVDAATLARVKLHLRALRPEARLVEAVGGHVPEQVLTFPEHNVERRPAAAFVADVSDHAFRTWAWRPEAALDPDRLRALLAALPRAVLRVKGFCRLGPGAEPHLLQYAGERWALTPCGAAAAPGLVVIGTADMPAAAALRDRFARTLA